MRRPDFVADIETDGLLDQLTRVHLLTIARMDSDDVLTFRRNDREDTIEQGLKYILGRVQAGEVVGFHNGIEFDVPAIRKVYPWCDLPPDRVFDTLVFSRLKYSDIKIQYDGKAINRKENPLPRKYYGAHSLESWGARLGVLKGEYTGDTTIEDEKARKATKWDAWNQDMEDYGVQDVVVTKALVNFLRPEEYSQESLALEHSVRWIISRQERRGVAFDEEAAGRLYADLAGRREEISRKLISEIPPAFWMDGPKSVPKRDNRTLGYVKGAPFQKIKLEEFNPTSRRHIARFFRERYGWQPTEFTEGGDPKLDDDILNELPFPEAKPIAEIFTLSKRLGQLAEGPASWMQNVRKGRIHGRVNTNGTVTGRMSHSQPNMNVPKVGSYLGAECRALFIARDPYLYVGGDASGIELRMLGHYAARYDGGAYARVVVEGKSEEGTDVHSLNCKALGMDPKREYIIGGASTTGRNVAKTFIYALLYGAGPDKIASILGVSRKKAIAIRKQFLRNIPALGKLIADVGKAVTERKRLRGLDGRILPIRSKHAALNTLLQSAGGVVMKRALVICDSILREERGLTVGVDYEFVMNVHDEFSIEALPHCAEAVAAAIPESIRRAGESFNLRCPLTGEAHVGRSWRDVH